MHGIEITGISEQIVQTKYYFICLKQFYLIFLVNDLSNKFFYMLIFFNKKKIKLLSKILKFHDIFTGQNAIEDQFLKQYSKTLYINSLNVLIIFIVFDHKT